PATVRRLVVTAEEFELLKDDPAWPEVVKRLRKPKSGDSRSSLLQIHVAALALRRGLRASLEPPSGNGKSLDVHVQGVRGKEQSREFFIECTENQPLPDAVKRLRDGTELWPFQWIERGIQARIDLEPDLSEAEMARVEEQLTQLYDDV